MLQNVLENGRVRAVPNSLNRCAVSSWMPFKYDPAGSLDLFFQNAKRPVQPHDASLCAEERRADRQGEPTTRNEGSRADTVAGAITVVVTRRRFLRVSSEHSLQAA